MKDMIKTYVSFIIYSYLPILVVLTMYLFGHTYINTNMNDLLLLNIICDFLFVIIFIIFGIDIFKKHSKLVGNSKKDKIIYFIKTGIIAVLLLYAIKIISALVVSIISLPLGLTTESDNQSLLEDLFKQAPFINIFCGAVLAPITEELIFRGSIRRVIKNKKVFVIVSGLTFGLVHVLNTYLPIFAILILGCLIDNILSSNIKKNKKIWLSILASVVMLLVLVIALHTLSGDIIALLTNIKLSEAVNSISYIAMGVCFAFIYIQYDNIYINIFCHMLNNAIAYIFLLTLL